MSAPRTLYTRSGDADLAYQVIGAGARDVVLILDWASQLEVLWEQPFVQDFVDSLTRFGRVLWFDMRGVGLSARVAEDFVAAEDWMEDACAVMDAADSERATLVAHGHATQMALLTAATHPDRVESIVLLNGFARLLRGEGYDPGMPDHVAEETLSRIEQLWGTGAMAAVLAPSLADQPAVADWYGRVERFAATPATAVAKMRAILELDVRHVVPLVKAPTLVIHNRENAFIRVGHGRYLAENIPGAQLIERASPDHWPLPDADLLGAIEEFVTGARIHFAETDRVLTTVLFVDVVDSTERASELGDRRWQRLLDRFDETARDTVLVHRGEVVNTAGDEILATFDGPARAIHCAWQIGTILRRAGLDVRCGIHSGEVTRRNGSVAGIAVHIGARVSAAASPGEVLVTRTVRDLAAGSGIVFADRGEHALKGVPERWNLYAATTA